MTSVLCSLRSTRLIASTVPAARPTSRVAPPTYSSFPLSSKAQQLANIRAHQARQPANLHRNTRCFGTRFSKVAAMAADPKRVLVPVADGCEEMEAVIVIDVLVRAGASVTVASVDGPTVTCSRGVKLQADRLVADVASETFDLIAVPGGMPGAEHFRDCEQLVSMLREQKAAGRLYAAICASPAIVFEHHGLLEGAAATSHPGFQSRLTNQESVAERVVEVGKLTTSQGPGTAFEFALSLVKQLYGPEKMKEIAGPMVMYPASILES